MRETSNRCFIFDKNEYLCKVMNANLYRNGPKDTDS